MVVLTEIITKITIKKKKMTHLVVIVATVIKINNMTSMMNRMKKIIQKCKKSIISNHNKTKLKKILNHKKTKIN